MNTNRHPCAPEPKPEPLFARRIWNRSMTWTPMEVAALNTIHNLALEATIAKVQSGIAPLNLTTEQRQAVYEMLSKKFSEEILPQVYRPIAQMTGLADKVSVPRKRRNEKHVVR